MLLNYSPPFFLDTSTATHMQSLNRYFSGDCTFVADLSSTAFLVQLDHKFFVVHICSSQDDVDSVAHVLSISGHYDSENLLIPSHVASMASSSSRLLLTSFMQGTPLAVSDVANVLSPALLFSSWLEAIITQENINMRSTFDYFYRMILHSLSDCVDFSFLFKQFPSLPPVVRQCYVHGDLVPQNFLSVHGKNCFSLIDWEYAGFAFEGFDRGWFLAVCSFRGFCDPFPHLKTANDLYFLRFGYFRLVARLLRRRSGQKVMSDLMGIPYVDDGFVDASLPSLQHLLETCK